MLPVLPRFLCRPWLILFTLFLLLFGCNTPAPTPTPVSDLILKPEVKELYVGESLAIVAEV
ncbi:MAG: hypothetical protein KC443_07305, partial [Anaerolineales bacterium]|nr:hypothetical protein [Anaerolineales bacterium]